MNFWGVQVKGGEPCKVEIGSGKQSAIHISQACLEELKKGNGNESFLLYAKTGDKQLLIGTLSPLKWPQISLSLVFDTDFELSHNWKHGVVHFAGYSVPLCESPDDYVRVNLESQDAERKSTVEKVNTAKSGSKQKVKIEEPNKYDKLGEDTDDSSNDEEDNDYQDMVTNGEGDSSDDEDDDESDEDDDDSDEDEETPKKVESSKKRSVEPAKRTLVPDKKAKFVTPQKTDGPKKVGGHTATPYPSKKPAKLLATSFQKNDQSPKSFACNSCKRSFGSENALQSHSKAKHGAS